MYNLYFILIIYYDCYNDRRLDDVLIIYCYYEFYYHLSFKVYNLVNYKIGGYLVPTWYSIFFFFYIYQISTTYFLN